MTCRHDRCDFNPTQPTFYSRRSIITALASAAVLSAGPLLAAPSESADDERFMRLALDEARQGDFPFGAVIVRDGQVLARGRNLGKTNDDPTAHGEMVAIRRCLTDYGSASLRGSTLYTSGEPCAMCMGAILASPYAKLSFAGLVLIGQSLVVRCHASSRLRSAAPMATARRSLCDQNRGGSTTEGAASGGRTGP